MEISNTQKKKILIVEDEQILGDIMLHKLVSVGYDVFLSTDGALGLAKAREWMPDLVLLDLLMPKMSGQEMLEIMRSDGTLKSIPIVIISNSGQQSELERVIELGVVDYVIKAQFSPDELVKKVSTYLDIGGKNQQDNTKHIAVVKNNIKILLAEDDKFISSLVIQQLVKEGYTVLSATTGQQALSIFSENKPDLVILDIVMPDMNGLEVLKSIRSDVSNNDVIVGFFSNNGQEHEVEEAQKYGADYFFVKVNFTLREFAEKIHFLLVSKGKL